MSLNIDLRRIQDSIQQPPPGVLYQPVGAFAVTIHPENPLPWFNDAVPEVNPTDDDVRAMVELFRRYDRRPRLEFLRELWPAVPALLEKHGFRLKDTQPAMALEAPDWSSPMSTLETRMATPEDAPTIDYIGNLAFAGDGPDPLREQAIRDSISQRRSKAALGFIDGRAVGSGRIVGVPDVREVVSIGTVPEYRNLGVATAVTATLLNDFFATGGELAWLTSSEHANTLYTRLGFKPVASQVCYLLD